ncbi:hypothetical protein E3E12_02980 [Formicincola oecophyllae]|uniref:Uncharacterized protein n=1 Tax=Formicincola oecophyllae TaxID=2558361 RepID=A0A4Y6UA52_9PROT|nr:hypothetical protein [Formicincola oecophyllae]QDH13336.1 hypothetical protein E3E12_02980 [Formicincola oecophyllae]
MTELMAAAIQAKEVPTMRTDLSSHLQTLTCPHGMMQSGMMGGAMMGSQQPSATAIKTVPVSSTHA